MTKVEEKLRDLYNWQTDDSGDPIYAEMKKDACIADIFRIANEAVEDTKKEVLRDIMKIGRKEFEDAILKKAVDDAKAEEREGIIREIEVVRDDFDTFCSEDMRYACNKVLEAIKGETDE